MKFLLTLILIILWSNPGYCGNLGTFNPDDPEEEEKHEKIDDWQFDQNKLHQDQVSSGGGSPVRFGKSLGASRKTRMAPPVANIAIGGNASMANMGSVAPAPQSLGFAVGGAKDSQSFNQNLEKGYLPKYGSITYEGVFYNYYFDTGIGQGKCDYLFCPSYTRGVAEDIYSGNLNYYLSVGLNSGMTEENFQRKLLNLVIVVDISGSMGGQFSSYYYDGRHQTKGEKQPNKSKMQLANESIVAMMKHLNPDDRFGVVLFDDSAYVAKPLRLVGRTDMDAISRHVLELKPQGGTNWKAGYKEGNNLFSSMIGRFDDPTRYENRIIFITDAMPNRGELSEGGLFGMVDDGAQKGIYTSFIGVGIDFNADLVEHVTKTRGANYFSVKSASEFKKRLADEFDFLVTPLVFDLELQLTSDSYTIDGVFGSPEADLATGEVMKINTLFPSPIEQEQVKGGVVLVKLKKVSSENDEIILKVNYKDRVGKQFTSSKVIRFSDGKTGYDNNGIRKAVLLTEYISLIKNWLLDAHKGCNDQVDGIFPVQLFRHGLINPQIRPEIQMLSTWERKSCPLEVSPGYTKFFTLFSKHFREEMKTIGDTTLEKELEVLKRFTLKNEHRNETPSGPIDDWITPN